MSLTPICREAGEDGPIFPHDIPYSALLESGYSSTGTVATDCTIALGFKPTAASIAPLNDMTAHYLLTIQKIGTTVRVWKQGVGLENYTGTVDATYAAFLSNVMTAYCGSNKGYYSRLYVVEQGLTYSDFWEPADIVTGLWRPKTVAVAPLVCLAFGNAIDLGEDSSSNGNNWTVTGSPAQTADTPTRNLPTFNAQYGLLTPFGKPIYSNGNRTSTYTTNAMTALTEMAPKSGKWAARFNWGAINAGGWNTNCGVCDREYLDSKGTAGQVCGYAATGTVVVTPSTQGGAYGAVWNVGEAIDIKFNVDTGEVSFVRSGTDDGLAHTMTDLGTDFFFFAYQCGPSDVTYDAEAIPPDGYKAMVPENHPDPTILKSSTVADVVLRVGMAGQQFTDGTAYSVSEFDSSVQHDGLAFDNSTSTFWQSARETAHTGPWWLAYKMPVAKQIKSYSITPRSGDYNRGPKDFKLQGSNDTTNGSNGTWDDLDTNTGVVYTSMTPKVFIVDTPGLYATYRLYITYVQDSYGTCNMSEFVGLVGDTVIELPDMEGGPDWVNTKARTAAYHWIMTDKERGAGKQLYTNLNAAQGSVAGHLDSFLSNGYRIGSDANSNGHGVNFLDLCLKAGVDQGFEIVTVSHTEGTPTTFNHGLGKPLTFVLFKGVSVNSSWYVYHTALGMDKFLKLEDTTAAIPSAGLWTTNTSTQFGVSGGFSTGDYVAYCFTDSDIFKAFSYTGNASTDGPLVNLGGKPLSIPFTKNSSAVSFWLERSNAQSPFNPVNEYLKPSEPDGEATSGADNQFTSQGFKIGNISGSDNGSGNLIVGLAILESTKYSNAH